MGSYGIAWSGCLQPVRVLLQLAKQIFKPAIRITKLVRAGPHAELFQVIAHRRKTARMLARGAAQKVHRVSDGAKRKQVTQRFQAGKNIDGVTLVLGAVVAKQLAQLEARAEKMIVIHERVFHAGRRERRWKLRLPDALGEPRAFRPRAEMLLHIIGQPRDLLYADRTEESR